MWNNENYKSIMSLITSLNKQNFFRIKRLDNESLNPEWSYSWRVESNKSQDNSFYTIHNVPKNSEMAFSTLLSSCYITFHKIQMTDEEIVVKCYVKHGSDEFDLECVYEQYIEVENNDTIMEISGIELDTCCDYIDNIKGCYVFISEDTNNISSVQISINSGRICDERNNPTLGSIVINCDQSKIYENSTSQYNGLRYVYFTFKWEDNTNSVGYKLTATGISSNGLFVSQPLSKRFTPFFNVLNGSIKSSLLSNIIPPNSISNSEQDFVSYTINLYNLAYFRDKDTTFQIKRFTGQGESLDLAKQNAEENISRDVYETVFDTSISNILSQQPFNLLLKDTFKESYFYQNRDSAYYYIKYNVSYLTSSDVHDCETCGNSISFDSYLMFEECPTNIKIPELTISIDSCVNRIDVPSIVCDVNVNQCSESIIIENFPCVTYPKNCSESIIIENFPCVTYPKICSESIIIENFPCVESN